MDDTMTARITRNVARACLAATLLPGTAPAQTSDWHFGAALYGWFPSLGGTTTFPAASGGSSVNVDIDTILDSLQFVFMGTLEARRGRWGAFTDVVYLDLGKNRSETRDIAIGGGTLPDGASASLDYDLKGFLWTLAGSYRLLEDRGGFADVFAGARKIDVDQKLDYSLSGNVNSIPVLDRSGRRSVNSDNWDGIIGVKGRLAFGQDHRWFVPWYLDVGTGDSDLTWQAMAGIGYSFSWGDMLASWRYLDYAFKSGNPVQDLDFSGPMLGVVFRW